MVRSGLAQFGQVGMGTGYTKRGQTSMRQALILGFKDNASQKS